MFQPSSPDKAREPDDSGIENLKGSSSPVTPILDRSVNPSPRPGGAPVAVYKDPYAGLRRQIIRVSLLFVAPALFVAIVVVVIYLTITLNAGGARGGSTSESVTMGNIPLPAGIREISKEPDPIYSAAAEGTFNSIIPNYRAISRQTEIYVTSRSADDLTKYYADKLVKGVGWRQFNKDPIVINYDPYSSTSNKDGTNVFVIYLYLHSTNDPKVVEGLRIQYEKLGDDSLKRRAGLVGRKAEAGDTLIYLSKLTLRVQG